MQRAAGKNSVWGRMCYSSSRLLSADRLSGYNLRCKASYTMATEIDFVSVNFVEVDRIESTKLNTWMMETQDKVNPKAGGHGTPL